MECKKYADNIPIYDFLLIETHVSRKLRKAQCRQRHGYSL